MSLCCTAWLYLALAGPLCLARFGLLFPAFCSIIKAVNAERLVSTIGGSVQPGVYVRGYQEGTQIELLNSIRYNATPMDGGYNSAVCYCGT